MPKYDPDVWFQISGKYRMVARFPPGMSGIEALKTLHIRPPQWAEAMGEGLAGDHYLRRNQRYRTLHSSQALTATLTHEEWKKFRDDGGTTYLSRCYKHKMDRIKYLVQEMVRDGLIYPDKVDKVVHVLYSRTVTD